MLCFLLPSDLHMAVSPAAARHACVICTCVCTFSHHIVSRFRTLVLAISAPGVPAHPSALLSRTHGRPAAC